MLVIAIIYMNIPIIKLLLHLWMFYHLDICNHHSNPKINYPRSWKFPGFQSKLLDSCWSLFNCAFTIVKKYWDGEWSRWLSCDQWEPRGSRRNDTVDSRFVPSKWETLVLCNDVSHWLGAILEGTFSGVGHAVTVGTMQDEANMTAFVAPPCTPFQPPPQRCVWRSPWRLIVFVYHERGESFQYAILL